MLQLKDGFHGERAVIVPRPVIHQIESDPFLRQLYVTDIGYYPNARYHFRQRDQGTPQSIVIYCTDGKGWVECNNQKNELSANQYIIIPAHTAHIYGADKENPWTIYWLHFQGDIAHTYGGATNAMAANGGGFRLQELQKLFEEIFDTLRMGYTAENLHYSCSCLYHFLGLLTFKSGSRQSPTPHQYNIIEQTIEFMKENLEKTLTATEIAQYIGYSYSHLSALFFKRIGYSPCNYFLRLKMQQACHYLDFTDMKINQICCKIGIDDPYYFSRLFRKVVGVSPQIYRNQINGLQDASESHNSR